MWMEDIHIQMKEFGKKRRNKAGLIGAGDGGRRKLTCGKKEGRREKRLHGRKRKGGGGRERSQGSVSNKSF